VCDGEKPYQGQAAGGRKKGESGQKNGLGPENGSERSVS